MGGAHVWGAAFRVHRASSQGAAAEPCLNESIVLENPEPPTVLHLDTSTWLGAGIRVLEFAVQRIRSGT